MKRQAVKKLIQCAAVIAAGVLAIILFMLAIWYRGKNSEPVTDEQVAAQMQQAEPLVIETPEAATEGSIRVYDYDGCTHAALRSRSLPAPAAFPHIAYML